MTNSANRLFDAASERILAETWEHYPSMASRLGLHEYDGRLPSISMTAMAKRASQLRQGLELLENIDTAALSVRGYYDHRILTAALRKELLELTELRWHEFNPMEMLWHIDLSGYVQRDYAPPEQRVEALTRALEAVPGYIAELRNVMSGRLASPVLEASIEAYEGIAVFYENDLLDAAGALADGELRARFEVAVANAAEPVLGFVEHLKALRPYADAGFAIGKDSFRRCSSMARWWTCRWNAC